MHLSRIKAKFKRLAKRLWPSSLNGKKYPWRDGGNIRYDREGWLDREAARRANHPVHDCEMCKHPRYEREHFDVKAELEKDEYEE